MKIRRYLGKDTQEAILKVKMDLGSEAVIMSTRKVRKKGISGWFGKPMVEVLAAIDEVYVPKNEPPKARAPRPEDIKPVRREDARPSRPEEPRYERPEEPRYERPEEPRYVRPEEERSARSEEDRTVRYEDPRISRYEEIRPIKKETKVVAVVSEQENKISELENKFSSMESLMSRIYEEMKSDKVNKAHEKVEKVEKIEKFEMKKPEHSKVLEMFYNNLVRNEIDPELARKIIDKVREKVGVDVSVNDAASIIQNILAGMLGKPDTIRNQTEGRPQIVLFVGPTGVGKTTTLAKIAANFSLNQKKEVGLITADTYRIAAVEQLKTYGEILGMPVSVIYSANEIQEAIRNYSSKDVVLIDTAGRSYNNKPQFDELKALVTACEADEVFLVLSATTSLRNVRDILNNYSFLNNYKLIFTKLDETSINGIILNARYITKKNISYITTGQSVPDDIEIANVDKLSKTMLGSIS